MSDADLPMTDTMRLNWNAAGEQDRAMAYVALGWVPTHNTVAHLRRILRDPLCNTVSYVTLRYRGVLAPAALLRRLEELRHAKSALPPPES